MKYVLTSFCLLIVISGYSYGAQYPEQVDSLCAVADHLYKRSAYDSAKLIYHEAMAIVEERADSSKMAEIWNALGSIAYYQNDFPEAMKFFMQYMRFIELHGEGDEYVKALINIGSVHQWQNNLEKAKTFFDKALAVSIENDDLYHAALAYQNIGVFFWIKEMRDSSLVNCRRSFAIFEQLGESIRAARLASNIGILYGEIERYDSAIVNHKRALQVFEKEEDRFSVSKASNNLANVYLLSGKPNLAKPLIDKGLSIGKETGSFSLQKISYENYLLYYQMTQLPDSIFSVVDKLMAVKDSIMNESTTEQINELQAKYESDKKEQEIANLSLAKTNAEARRNIYLISTLTIFCIAAFILFWFLYRIRKNRQLKQKEELIVKQQFQQYEFQLKTYTDRLVEKSIRIEELNHEIELVKNDISGECPSYNGTIDHLMQSTILTHDEWMEYKKLFTQVYPGFFNSLRKSYNDLTDTEERLLALSKLNLQNKEIASMIGISVKSVNKSKYRLRKKLKINPEDFEEIVASF
ncbi:tetratricopeptide repeat protein [Fulvivirga sp. M361]|uniref:tetratricopeptide repeat protein n=1 Tax=Fulvivirga sp. M361 TaxID=2594266 RepID=UPI00117AD720|nr:tetratricopeptide repeat protein [Fulvivirga sp. M361]TRX58861.1 tetratricopeptide repeat protein [Fulvivirga sp. M361]